MAGIGFEIKKVLKNKTVLGVFWGHMSAILVTSGPMVISILQLVIVDMLLRHSGVSLLNREIIRGALLYAYIFSMIISSGYVMVVTRFIADRLFEEDTKDVLSSFVGASAIILATGGLVFFMFYLRSPLPWLTKYLSYLIFAELSIIYLIMAYITAIKEYHRIIVGFSAGTIITVSSTLLSLRLDVDMITTSLASIGLGYFVVIILLLDAIIDYFGYLSNNNFAFLSYFKKYHRLFFISLFYTTGLFVHNIMFWFFSDMSVRVKDTFVYASAYDTATFFAVLTTIPAAIIFTVKFETAFYEKFRVFCEELEWGSLKRIQETRNDMIETLNQEYSFLVEMQFIITIILIIIGIYAVLPRFIFDVYIVQLFAIMSIAFFLSYMSFVAIIMLIYFDFQKAALRLAAIFLILTVVLTAATIVMGPSYYGLGYIFSSMITFFLSSYVLNAQLKNIKNIDYRIYTNKI